MKKISVLSQLKDGNIINIEYRQDQLRVDTSKSDGQYYTVEAPDGKLFVLDSIESVEQVKKYAEEKGFNK